MKAKSMMSIVGAVSLAMGMSTHGIAAPDPKPKPMVSIEAGIMISDSLEKSRPSWAGSAARDIVAIMPVDGRVTVLVRGDTAKVTAVKKRIPTARASVVDVVPGGFADAAGPSADTGGWSGGNWINTSVRCTEGFAWRSWSTGVIRGSTARHCGLGRWTHNGRYVGSTSQRGTGANDVELISPAAGTRFSPDAWIRIGNGQIVLRPVQDTGANVVGGAIAFYGRTSGGGVGRIVSTRVNGINGLVLSTNSQVRLGDSGGPVYITHTNGTIEARGTVSALAYADLNKNGRYDPADKVTGLVYTDITYSSANLRASVYTR